MKTTFSLCTVAAAALMILPVVTWAEEAVNDEFTDAPPALNIPAPASPTMDPSGIVVREGAAYIVHRLQSEMTLADGSTVKPNGTIQHPDGSTGTVNGAEMLSLDGQMKRAPFSMGDSPLLHPEVPVMPASTTPAAPSGSFSPSSPNFPGTLDSGPASLATPQNGDFSD